MICGQGASTQQRTGYELSSALEGIRMTNRNRLWPLWMVGVVAGLMVTGCASGGAAGDSGGPLVIGASLSLTGDFADPGLAMERGYQLWARTVNKQGGILGRQVRLDIVDDGSSPTKVVTNYQNLINKDHVDLTLGPYSTLLTIPASQVANRYGYAFLAPAGGGPAVFQHNLHDFFFVQPAPTVQSGEVFVTYVLSLPVDQRPKTAAYAELDDPFSAPLAEDIRQKLEAAGVRTVYKVVYPAETSDLTQILKAIAALHPDAIIGGTQNQDAYNQVKGLVQLKYSPKFMFQSNGANSSLTFPSAVGANNTEGIMTAVDWYPGSMATGSTDFTDAYLEAYGGATEAIDDNSAEAYAAGQLLSEVAARKGKIDNATIISALHTGTWPTILGDLSWAANGAPTGESTLMQWLRGYLLPVFPLKMSMARPEQPKPDWGTSAG
jgi:branched-chain amino acid transport system substrate-binding protein